MGAKGTSPLLTTLIVDPLCKRNKPKPGGKEGKKGEKKNKGEKKKKQKKTIKDKSA